MSLSRDRHRIKERVADTSEILASVQLISQSEKNQCPVMGDFKEKVVLFGTTDLPVILDSGLQKRIKRLTNHESRDSWL